MVRVVILDHQSYHREAIKSVLMSQPDIDVIGAASDFGECLAASARADVALLEQGTTQAETCWMIEQMRRERPETAVVLFRVTGSPDTILDYLETGTRGYILNDDTSEHLLNVVRVAATRDALVEPHLVGPLLDRLADMRELILLLAERVAQNGQPGAHRQPIVEMVTARHSEDGISAVESALKTDDQARVDELRDAYDIDDRDQLCLLLRLLDGRAASRTAPGSDTSR